MTDDSELAMALAKGLINGRGEFDLIQIALEYRRWFKSGPFDIGNTTY